ncbi:MAG: tetraacyldisaccharide 4'-kinase [Longimicrobiales bacterium]
MRDRVLEAGANRQAIGTAEQKLERLWNGEGGSTLEGLRLALAPFEAVYRLTVAARNRAYDAGLLRTVRVDARVLSVGNLSVGGTGKTPVAAWLAAELVERGQRPAILHGGYATDEPDLHRVWNPNVPVIVGRDRVAGGMRAIAGGSTVLVLDDGFQHRRLERDLDLVLIAAESWTPAPKLLPRGPWRERPDALRRATLIAITRKTADAARTANVVRSVRAFSARAPIVTLAIRPAGWRRADGREGKPPGEVVAVAGIAAPAPFVANAREAGAHVSGVITYSDHHAYDARDGDSIASAAQGRAIVTTEKDWMKLAGRLDDTQVWLLRQRVDVEAGEHALGEAIETLLA